MKGAAEFANFITIKLARRSQPAYRRQAPYLDIRFHSLSSNFPNNRPTLNIYNVKERIKERVNDIKDPKLLDELLKAVELDNYSEKLEQ